MPWYGIVILICLIVGPFDALYMHIKAEKRRDAIRRAKGEPPKDETKA